MSSIAIRPARHPFNALVSVPGSKSFTNRSLVTSALACGTSRLTHILLANDTRLMIDALRGLGVSVMVEEDQPTAIVTGTGGQIPETHADLYCGNSGTTIRFLTAMTCLGQGRYRLDGTSRMGDRPIGPLVDALRQLHGRFEYEARDGYPPLVVHANGLSGGEVFFDSQLSSQYLSALLMAAPMASNDVFIEVSGPLPSGPYVDMTLAVMRAFGVEVIEGGQVDSRSCRWIVAAPQRYTATDYSIEPDATAAGYFWAAAAVNGGSVTVSGLTRRSLQGDIGFVDALARMGCTVTETVAGLTMSRLDPSTPLRGIDVDLNAMPDAAPTLAVTALFAEGPTRIRGVANLRFKESDRIGALAHELRRLGAKIEVHEDGLTLHPPKHVISCAVQTYDDHRLAMSFALAGLAVEGIVINDPECVTKTYPGFFEKWESFTTPRPSSVRCSLDGR